MSEQIRNIASVAADLKILVVEDNAMNQKLARAVLGRLGYTAHIVADGYEALAAIERAAYDAVLMDMQLPGMDGVETTRAIRARGHRVHQPRIIAMTANALLSDRARCLAAGMDDYVSKPVAWQALEEALRAAARD